VVIAARARSWARAQDVNSWVSSVSIGIRLRAGRLRFSSRQGAWWDFFSLLPPADRLWGPASQGVKLTTHLHLVQRLRMRGAVPPLPYKSLWRGAHLSTGTTLSLTTLRQSSVFWRTSEMCICVGGRGDVKRGMRRTQPFLQFIPVAVGVHSTTCNSFITWC